MNNSKDSLIIEEGSVKLKEDVSFEHWEYEIGTLRKVYTESAMKEAITKSLTGSAAESLRSLGPLPTTEQILESMKRKYGITASDDSLIRDFMPYYRKNQKKFLGLLPKLKLN